MTEAQKERELQRVDSEARDIIHDIDRLNTFPENKKSRWVWELLQNAKDVATEDGVNITYELKNNQVIFSHDGLPFETKHLLAILYKTSTKSLGGDDGTTGKYGTGFVTTHILSKKLSITGVHQLNEDTSLRNFTISIDRSSALLDETKALDEMKKAINSTFDQINAIESQPKEIIQNLSHSFIYDLSDTSLKYAVQGLEELEKNLPFVLLINSKAKKKINSVTIIKNGSSKVFTIEPTESKILGVKYIKTQENEGILYKENDNLIIGIPVTEVDNNYVISEIERKCVLYKEFPLIGSENFNLPVFIQHKNFKPTEERDGVRTKKENEGIDDSAADTNRGCLIEFTNEYLALIMLLIKNKCKNIFHLALSGLPEFSEKYNNKEWYTSNIQNPIRSLILSHPILENELGNFIYISETKFPIIELLEDEGFYGLLVDLRPEVIPSTESLKFWNKIINQESETWTGKETISLEQLLDNLPNCIDLTSNIVYEKLKKVYSYLESKNSKLGETFPIYLNSKDQFRIRNQVKLYPLIDDEIKIVSKGLGRDLDEEFLNKNLGNIAGIEEFDLTEFYKKLNTELISTVSEKTATAIQIKAILHVCSLFRSDRASKREKWFSVIKQLLPDQIGDKIAIKIDYENYATSAELWSVKYISHLIELEGTIDFFAKKYFEDNETACFEWLNDFLSHVFSMSEENRTVLFQRKIIPVQTGEFKDYSDFRFLEENPRYFDDSIKDIYKNYTPKGDPRSFLIDNRIKTEAIRTIDIDILTKEIDKLFDDRDVEGKVKKDGILHEAFLKLNNWFELHSDGTADLKTFSNKRAMLYVIALGEGFSKQVMSLKESGKSMEDIAELAKIKLSTAEMKELERVANELGTVDLLKKAEEMIHLKEQREKWKKIGKTAEDAFKKVFENLDIDMQISNPDVGKDFELILKSDKFSIEIKNVIEGKGNVRMSILQGRTAVLERDKYALCVVTRPDDISAITEDYFIQNAKFVKDIGYQIGDKISDWDTGLNNLLKSENINILLDQKTESVYINKPIWTGGITFQEFVENLKSKVKE